MVLISVWPIFRNRFSYKIVGGNGLLKKEDCIKEKVFDHTLFSLDDMCVWLYFKPIP